jgi:hypothetical protein
VRAAPVAPEGGASLRATLRYALASPARRSPPPLIVERASRWRRYEQFVANEFELSAGDYFGTSAILGSGERKRHSTMIAVTDVQVIRLGRAEFEAGQTLHDGRTSSDPLAMRERDSSGALADMSALAESRRSSGTPTGGALASAPSSPTAANPLAGMRRISANNRSARRSLRFINMMSNNELRKYATLLPSQTTDLPSHHSSASKRAAASWRPRLYVLGAARPQPPGGLASMSSEPRARSLLAASPLCPRSRAPPQPFCGTSQVRARGHAFP